MTTILIRLFANSFPYATPMMDHYYHDGVNVIPRTVVTCMDQIDGTIPCYVSDMNDYRELKVDKFRSYFHDTTQFVGQSDY